MSEEKTAEPPQGSWVREIVASPIVQTLLAMFLITIGTWTEGLRNPDNPFVLTSSVESAPWTILTSIYAHHSIEHLLGNALVIVTAGTVLAMATTTFRFHAYVLVTGGISGLAQLVVAAFFGPPVVVLGISGAGFAIIGYLLSSNRLSTILGDRLSRQSGVIIVVVVAVGLAVLLGGPETAQVAHLTGAVLGLVAGRRGLLAT